MELEIGQNLKGFLLGLCFFVSCAVAFHSCSGCVAIEQEAKYRYKTETARLQANSINKKEQKNENTNKDTSR
jgi:hypothetical protein